MGGENPGQKPIAGAVTPPPAASAYPATVAALRHQAIDAVETARQARFHAAGRAAPPSGLRGLILRLLGR